MTLKRVLVTGGTGALGAEIVRALTASTPGFAVKANFHRDVARAQAVRKETGCDLVQADVGDESQVEKMIEEVLPLFAVVHAAGRSHDGLLARQSREAWNAALQINADSVFFIARNALQKLEDGGRLVFVSSRAGEQGRAGQAAYAAGKAAALAVMKCAAREGAARHIAVNAVCPGLVPSALTDTMSTARLERARRSGLGREFGKAAETAALIKWLLAEDSEGISGQIFHCDDRL